VQPGAGGFLWLATHDGLVRFDGVRFATFGVADTPALPSNRIDRLWQAASGRLWVQTADERLALYHEGHFTRPGAAQGLPGARAVLLRTDVDGGALVGTPDGLWRFVPGQDRFVPVAPSVLTTWAQSAHHAPDGTLWVGARDGTVVQLARGGDGGWAPVTHLRAPAGASRVHRLATAPGGLLWIAADDGVAVYDGARVTRVAPFPMTTEPRHLRPRPGAALDLSTRNERFAIRDGQATRLDAPPVWWRLPPPHEAIPRRHVPRR
jgi:ligand-binding sensor domain-containing protein